MTGPGRRAVSYLPGRWAALVTDELCLLADLQLADPVLASCWEAASAGGAEAVERVLQTLMPAGLPVPPSFVLVARSGGGLRLVVAGRAHAEVFAGQQDPVVHGAPNPHSWVDEPLDPGLDVRLVADDATPFERIPPLPLTSGIVLASFVFSTALAAPVASAAEPQDEAAGWIPPPLAQPSSEFPVPPSLDVPSDAGWPAEPAAQLSGVFRALPWRSSFADVNPPAGDPPADSAGPASDDGAQDAPEAEQPAGSSDPGPYPGPPPDDTPKPSFGAPGYEPPPFGAEAWGIAGHAPEAGYPGYAPEPYPADVPPPPPSGYGDGDGDDVYGGYPPPPLPPPSGAGPAQSGPRAPLVQAVFCINGHPNPLHIDVCRACGAGFAPQQPVTVERPSLGVLRIPTGDVVPLDRDALLGRAPFAVDQASVRLVEVPSPDNDISRSHVRITLEGWQVFATDLGSTNGTAVTLPGQPATLLHPHDPFALVPGTVLSLADEADIRFDLQ